MPSISDGKRDMALAQNAPGSSLTDGLVWSLGCRPNLCFYQSGGQDPQHLSGTDPIRPIS